MSTSKPLAFAMAISAMLTPIEPTYRPPQRKVGSTNKNRAAQKRQRAARKKNR